MPSPHPSVGTPPPHRQLLVTGLHGDSSSSRCGTQSGSCYLELCTSHPNLSASMPHPLFPKLSPSCRAATHQPQACILNSSLPSPCLLALPAPCPSDGLPQTQVPPSLLRDTSNLMCSFEAQLSSPDVTHAATEGNLAHQYPACLSLPRLPGANHLVPRLLVSPIGPRPTRSLRHLPICSNPALLLGQWVSIHQHRPSVRGTRLEIPAVPP